MNKSLTENFANFIENTLGPDYNGDYCKRYAVELLEDFEPDMTLTEEEYDALFYHLTLALERVESQAMEILTNRGFEPRDNGEDAYVAAEDVAVAEWKENR